MAKVALRTAGTIFLLFSVFHLMRVFSVVRIIVNSYAIPTWWSGVAFGVGIVLSFWMFRAAK